MGETVLHSRGSGVLCCISLSKISHCREWFRSQHGQSEILVQARLCGLFQHTFTAVHSHKPSEAQAEQLHTGENTKQKKQTDKYLTEAWMFLTSHPSPIYTDFVYLFSSLSFPQATSRTWTLIRFPEKFSFGKFCCHRCHHEFQHVHILLNESRLFLWPWVPYCTCSLSAFTSKKKKILNSQKITAARTQLDNKIPARNR